MIRLNKDQMFFTLVFMVVLIPTLVEIVMNYGFLQAMQLTKVEYLRFQYPSLLVEVGFLVGVWFVALCFVLFILQHDDEVTCR